MEFDSREEGSSEYCPDGLTETAIDELLAEMARDAVARSGPTSALTDGSAAERKVRRAARRTFPDVVRNLPVRTTTARPLDEVA